MAKREDGYWHAKHVKTNVVDVGGTKVDAELLGRVLAERARVRLLGAPEPAVADPPQRVTKGPFRWLLKLIA